MKSITQTTIFFGKYRGKSFEAVHKSDPGYLMWLRNNLDWMTDPDPVREIIDTLFSVQQDLLPDQEKASNEICDLLLMGANRAHRLQGGAGYGKSYVVTDIAQHAKQAGFKVSGIANSYVATQVLAQSLDPVGIPSKTIASALALKPNKDNYNESYGPSEFTADNLQALLSDDSLLIVDEYSMCSDMVAGLIAEQMFQPGNTSKLLVVGDNCQLPSPEQEHMCHFDGIQPYSELTIPKRFDPDSTLHVLEKNVRHDAWSLSEHLKSAEDGTSLVYHKKPLDVYFQMLEDMENYPKETGLMLFYKRAAVAKANRDIRASVYGNSTEEIEHGERLRVMRTTFVPTAFNIANNRWEYNRYYSGTFLKAEDPEVRTITIDFGHKSLPANNCLPVEVECLTFLDPSGNRIPAVFSKSEHMADPETFGGQGFNKALNQVRDYCIGVNNWKLYHYFRSRFLQISYGYATTVHRSQGASVDRIYLDPKDVLQGGKFIAPRLAYVAATRAKEVLHFTL